MKKQTKKSENKFTVICIPGADRPWFIYDKVNRRSLTDGFKTLEAAQRYLKNEFGK